MFDDDESVLAAMRAGARGYVVKGAAPDNVVRAIAAVAARGDLRARCGEAGALGNATIASRLGLAPATVGNHVTSIFAKLQVASRAEAVVLACSAGLGGWRAHRFRTASSPGR
ncbi:MAG: LuxR C-terminal-related transcriptional regulator [Dermatophilaceae bacterium]